MKNINLILGVLLAVGISSCDKMENINPNATNSVFIEFENRAGASDLILGSTALTNTSGEDYTVTTLNYFVSNIRLMNEAGEMVSFADQYFLIKESDTASMSIELENVPTGNYHHLVFTLGVDSLKSISDVGQRVGVLDPASYGDDNMYWSWNMGYIFFKMEGQSSAVTNNGGQYEFHIDGFGGKDAATPNNIKNIELHVGSNTANVDEHSAPEIHVLFDASKAFDNQNSIKLADTPQIHNPKVGMAVSANYAEGFSVDHVHNDDMH